MVNDEKANYWIAREKRRSFNQTNQISWGKVEGKWKAVRRITGRIALKLCKLTRKRKTCKFSLAPIVFWRKKS